MERIKHACRVILERVPDSILELVQLTAAMSRGRVIGVGPTMGAAVSGR